jgi:hypothetical protein
MSQTLATSQFMAAGSDFESARRELYQQGIKSSYSDDVVIFNTEQNAKNTPMNPYVHECNGLILDRKTYKPLVVPTRTLKFNIDTNASNKFLHQGLYHIYKVQDGTCFNLYYFNDKWVVSTTRGYNMNNVAWSSDTNYQTIITQCLEKIGLTWDTFTSHLVQTNCYSFGFKHPLMHKFQEGTQNDVYKLWFIQSVCLDEKDESYMWSSETSPIAIIPSQEVYPDIVGNIRDLYKKSIGALQNYLDNGVVYYGFILRSVNSSQTLDNSDLFIESSLMRTIRKTWYENKMITACHANKWDKETAITLSAYLDSSNYEVFRKLFPNYDGLMVNYHNYLTQIVNRMINKTSEASQNVSEVAEIMLKKFKDSVSMNIKNQSNDSLFKLYFEYVCHPSSLDVFMQKGGVPQ